MRACSNSSSKILEGRRARKKGRKVIKHGGGDEAEEQRLGGQKVEWDAERRRASLRVGLWML